jgi:hypothetical protein
MVWELGTDERDHARVVLVAILTTTLIGSGPAVDKRRVAADIRMTEP